MFIIPYPKEIEESEGKLIYSSFTTHCKDEYIKDMYKGFSASDADTEIIVEKNENLTGEAYNLTIDKNGISIEYGEAVGAYRAMTTLKLIVLQSENNSIGYVKIHDYPSVKNRGYMLDISRSKIPNLSHIKKIVDIMADAKYNQLQLYMDSFVYEYKNFPEYWKDTKPLTKEEIKELDAYCKERFITLVPNQNGFGHMAAWTKKKELSHLAITDKFGNPSPTLNPLKKESLELIEKIYDGYFDAFSSDMVNIGMDEPNELGLNETKAECDKRGVGAVYAEYLKKVCALISNKYNKTPMFWDDVVFKHPEQLENLPKDAIVMDWGYESWHHFDRNCSILKENGLRFYVCPGTSMWLSFTGRTNNAIGNIISALEACTYYGGEGFLLTEWGDRGHSQMPTMTYFPLIFGGCFSWDAPGHVSVYFTRCMIEEYMDKVLFKTKGDKSLADIVYRMGNYYLLDEDALMMNITGLFYAVLAPEPIYHTERKILGFRRILKYMTDIKGELNEIKADEDALNEVHFSCDLVIFVAKMICGIHQDIEAEKNDIIKRYNELWVKKSHDIGMNDFTDRLEKAYNYYIEIHR